MFVIFACTPIWSIGNWRCWTLGKWQSCSRITNSVIIPCPWLCFEITFCHIHIYIFNIFKVKEGVNLGHCVCDICLHANLANWQVARVAELWLNGRVAQAIKRFFDNFLIMIIIQSLSMMPLRYKTGRALFSKRDDRLWDIWTISHCIVVDVHIYVVRPIAMIEETCMCTGSNASLP